LTKEHLEFKTLKTVKNFSRCCLMDVNRQKRTTGCLSLNKRTLGWIDFSLVSLLLPSACFALALWDLDLWELDLWELELCSGLLGKPKRTGLLGIARDCSGLLGIARNCLGWLGWLGPSK